jgi:hypothetical protein
MLCVVGTAVVSTRMRRSPARAVSALWAGLGAGGHTEARCVQDRRLQDDERLREVLLDLELDRVGLVHRDGRHREQVRRAHKKVAVKRGHAQTWSIVSRGREGETGRAYPAKRGHA